MAAQPFPENPYNPCAWIVGSPEIGEDTWIGAFTLIDGQGGLSIGKGCNISCGAQILTHSTVRRCITERVWPIIEKQPTQIEDHVFVGANAVILMGARIGHHSVIGAGTILLEGAEIPPYSLVVGVPGRIIRNIQDECEQWKALAVPMQGTKPEFESHEHWEKDG